MLLVACRPAPVLNPNKEPPATRGRPEVEREPELRVAPGGTVLATNGAPVDLAGLWAERPVVVVFYRGHWCPPCQRQLGELEARRADFTAANATLVAISSDPPADLAAMHDKLGLGFELYSDAELNVISRWGVEDLGNGIAKPATFVVKPDGSIAFSRVGDNVDDRPTVQQILDAIGTPAPTESATEPAAEQPAP